MQRKPDERRSFKWEIRETANDYRTITALVVPYDSVSQSTPVGDEMFMQKSFKRSVARIKQSGRFPKLLRAHDLRSPAGVATDLADTPEGLLGEFRIADTAIGNETRQEIAEGVMDGMSVGFTAMRERMFDGIRQILEARINEASVVSIGAYDDARVLSLRDRQPRIELPPRPTVNLAPIKWR